MGERAVTGGDVRALCLALPDTTEKATWGDEDNPGQPTFRVRDRIYVIMATDESSGSVRTTAGEQAELMSAFPDAARFASYVGRFGWVDVDFGGLPDDVLHEVIEGAWSRTAPRKTAAAWRSGR